MGAWTTHIKVAGEIAIYDRWCSRHGMPLGPELQASQAAASQARSQFNVASSASR